VPAALAARVRELCVGLPEVTVRTDESRSPARSAATSYDIRRRSFCLLVATRDATGTSVPMLVLRVHPDDRVALVSVGDPYRASRGARDRIRVLLTNNTDWDEVRALVTESYRLVAPKKLSVLIDGTDMGRH
jgi:hypothetical protein